MNIFNKTVYGILCLSRNKRVLNIVNKVSNIDDYNIIIPNLYLGNINYANNIKFLKDNNIEAILNCTESEPFNDYFENKHKFRLSINDSKSPENIYNFKLEIINCIDFIDYCIEHKLNIYVHCYWGLMRSATVVACYLIRKYHMSSIDAINIVKEQRPRALSSLYNFNEVIEFVENKYNRPK